jgi:hypothetical protein
MIPVVGYLPPSGPRVAGTVEAVRREPFTQRNVRDSASTRRKTAARQTRPERLGWFRFASR